MENLKTPLIDRTTVDELSLSEEEDEIHSPISSPLHGKLAPLVRLVKPIPLSPKGKYSKKGKEREEVEVDEDDSNQGSLNFPFPLKNHAMISSLYKPGSKEGLIASGVGIEGDGKMIGEWKLGEILGKGTSGELSPFST